MDNDNLNNMTYNRAMEELEQIVAKMQSEDCDIDNLTQYTRRGLQLLRLCKDKLLKTDEEIKKCLEELG